MFTECQSAEEFNQLVKLEKAFLAYFSTESCSVCAVLKPKVEKLIQTEFFHLKAVYVDSNKLPIVAGQNRIFAAPTIVVFFEGRETIRKSRSIGIEELRLEIERPYNMVFTK